MRSTTISCAGLLSLCLITAAAVAQPSAQADPFAELLFPPEIIMQHQAAIELSAEQRSRLVEEVTQAQAEIMPLQMDIAERGERLSSLLAPSLVDEEAAIATATEIMEIEARIKTRHLRLAIRLKNLLSVDQQTRLAELR